MCPSVTGKPSGNAMACSVLIQMCWPSTLQNGHGSKLRSYGKDEVHLEWGAEGVVYKMESTSHALEGGVIHGILITNAIMSTATISSETTIDHLARLLRATSFETLLMRAKRDRTAANNITIGTLAIDQMTKGI